MCFVSMPIFLPEHTVVLLLQYSCSCSLSVAIWLCVLRYFTVFDGNLVTLLTEMTCWERKLPGCRVHWSERGNTVRATRTGENKCLGSALCIRIRTEDADPDPGLWSSKTSTYIIFSGCVAHLFLQVWPAGLRVRQPRSRGGFCHQSAGQIEDKV